MGDNDAGRDYPGLGCGVHGRVVLSGNARAVGHGAEGKECHAGGRHRLLPRAMRGDRMVPAWGHEDGHVASAPAQSKVAHSTP